MTTTSAETQIMWDRSESRVFRPFRDAGSYLRNTMLRLHDEDAFSPDERRRIDDIDPNQVAPTIWITENAPDFGKQVGIPAEDLRLIIIVEDRLFKRSTVVLERQIPASSVEIRLPVDEMQVASWKSDTQIHVAIVLACDRESETGLARRRGSWLAKKSFRVSRSSGVSRFPIKTAPKEWFVSQHLPATTAYFLEVFDDLAIEAEDELRGAIEVVINENVLNALSRNPRSRISRTLTEYMYTDIVTNVLIAGFDGLHERPEERSALASIVDRVSKSVGISPDRIRIAANERRRTELSAIVQAHARLDRAIIEASRRGAR